MGRSPTFRLDACHLPRNRDIVRGAGRRVRLRHLSLGRSARSALAAVDLSRAVGQDPGAGRHLARPAVASTRLRRHRGRRHSLYPSSRRPCDGARRRAGIQLSPARVDPVSGRCLDAGGAAADVRLRVGPVHTQGRWCAASASARGDGALLPRAVRGRAGAGLSRPRSRFSDTGSTPSPISPTAARSRRPPGRCSRGSRCWCSTPCVIDPTRRTSP